MESFAKRGYFYYGFILCIAIALGCLHSYHVSTMFENDRHFSHLSEVEREMTFRTEMGLYFYYYKRLVQAPSFMDGLIHIMNDNLTEYPSTINTLQRFNLYPEIFLGGSYRLFNALADILGIETKQCWQVERGEDLPPVWSCEGLGDHFYFYLAGVWLCAGITVALLFLYGTLLSESAIGGIITVACFFFNHKECTRVQWTPPLRESFAYPICLAQMLCVVWCLRKSWPHWVHVATIGITTSAALVAWQFSQFAFLTQNIALVALWSLEYAPRPSVIVIFLGQLIGLQNAVLLLFANEMLLTSFYACSLMATLLVMILLEPHLRRYSNYYFGRTIVIGVCIATSMISLRNALALLVGSEDDVHIFNILRAKFTSYQDFHTMLYTCAAEFDFLPVSTLYELSRTLLLPTVYAVVICVILHTFGFIGKKPVERQKSFKAREGREGREVFIGRQPADVRADESSSSRSHDPAVLYTLLQTCAFFIMAVLVMRLKLFMTPHLCLMASLVASRKYMGFISSKFVHYSVLVALISAMAIGGLRNIQEQRQIMGEFSNPPLEELLHWINTETPKEAAFAGPMPIMASVLLSTQRPVVNHPHYEDAQLRERTKKVYRAFGRGRTEKLYRMLVEMKVTYLVVEDKWCYGQQRPGCSMLDIWDIEEPANRSLPPLCPLLIEGSPAPLQRVFSNEVYVVLRVPSRYVEVKLPRQYKE